jgi:hypothetical protein
MIDSANLYQGFNSNPTNFIDPMGLMGIFFGGTYNDISESESGFKYMTHLIALFNMYNPKNSKRIFIPGVGARTKILRGIFLGQGVKERLDAAFDFFQEQYNKGDREIDVFGFSRGAATARAFINMVHEKFPGVKFRFLGLFDTVAQFNPHMKRKGVNHFVDGLMLNFSIPDKGVGYTAHAVARNEYRSLFPLLSIKKHYNNYNGFNYFGYNYKRYKSNEIKEYKGTNYWEKPFDGAHSDVGGGQSDFTSNLESLWWMYNLAVEHGVPLDKDSAAFKEIEKYYNMFNGTHNSNFPVIDWGRKKRGVFEENMNPNEGY